MSIELHCPNCGKPIRAPDDAGGKRGKCPSCHQSVYIPSKPAEEEEIGLAPFDEDAERLAEELRLESAKYVAALDHDRPAQGEGAPRGAVGKQERPPAGGPAVDIHDEVSKFVVAMRNSKLDDAEKIVGRLKRAGPRAKDYVESLYMDQMPPQIEDVPPPLAKGFLKSLMARLS